MLIGANSGQRFDAALSEQQALARLLPNASTTPHSSTQARLALDESVYDGGRTYESRHAAPRLYVEIIEQFNLPGHANHLPLYRIKSRAGLSRLQQRWRLPVNGGRCRFAS